MELCLLGDTLILEKTSLLFKKKKDMPKGIAFPTCINVNHVVCHFSPSSAAESITLKQGDTVRMYPHLCRLCPLSARANLSL